MSPPSVEALSAPPVSAPADAPRFRVHAWTRLSRAFSALVLGLALVLLYSGAGIILQFTFTGAMNPHPPVLAGLLVLAALLGVGLERLWRRFTRATVAVEAERLVLERRAERLEIPLASVARIRGWRLPWPSAGLSLRMRSGRSLGTGLRVEDPLPVLTALGPALQSAREEARHPLTAFVHARVTVLRQRGLWLAFKFVLFPLLPGGIMFRANQYITFGGPFAQYRMYGLAPYLMSLFTYWVYFAAVLLLYAALWRLPAETMALAATWALPSRARGIRLVVEVACGVLYYAGSLSILASQFLS